ncbi:MAG: hypothetical protein NUV80_05540 [Candidatus Berkelbacteria bacterium]|nr:hypothetical protein [Candidatus Berkelbacteria bacterium]
MKLARFNNAGISAFRETLEYHRKGGRDERTQELVVSSNLIEPTDTEFTIATENIETRLDLAKSVLKQLSNLELKSVMEDVGLWAWLSAALFDVVCPADDNGNRSPGKDYRHVPSEGFRDFYRHLIRGPVRVLNLFEDNVNDARIVFCQPPNAPGDFVEQLASRQERVTSQSVIKVASDIFFDDSQKRPKKGAGANTAKPGTLRRYLNVLDQLDLTYDLYTISSSELLSLLPEDLNAPN